MRLEKIRNEARSEAQRELDLEGYERHAHAENMAKLFHPSLDYHHTAVHPHHHFESHHIESHHFESSHLAETPLSTSTPGMTLA
jgi:hypothetical protein